MSDYYSLRDDDLQEILKELPSNLGDKLKQRLESILDYWVWTNSDAVVALNSALEAKGVELNPERFEKLLDLFLQQSFECEYTTCQVNEHLADLARDFLASIQKGKAECEFSRLFQA